MTEANMKRLYEHYLATGQTGRAEQILAIPRYAKFKKTSEKPSEEKEKVPVTKSKKGK